VRSHLARIARGCMASNAHKDSSVYPFACPKPSPTIILVVSRVSDPRPIPIIHGRTNAMVHGFLRSGDAVRL
jgi:hypothetical protein